VTPFIVLLKIIRNSLVATHFHIMEISSIADEKLLPPKAGRAGTRSQKFSLRRLFYYTRWLPAAACASAAAAIDKRDYPLIPSMPAMSEISLD